MKDNNAVIKAVRQRLIQIYNPLKIYMFGSHGWGFPARKREFDLLVVLDEQSRGFTWDAVETHEDSYPILYSKEEFRSQLENRSSLCYHAHRKGTLLYARMSTMKDLVEKAMRVTYQGTNVQENEVARVHRR